MVDAHTWWRMGDRSYDFPHGPAPRKEDGGLTAWSWRGWKEPMQPDDHEAYSAALKEEMF